jgi:hypothetical protein
MVISLKRLRKSSMGPITTTLISSGNNGCDDILG